MGDPATGRGHGGFPGPRRPLVGRADEPERARPSGAPRPGPSRPGAPRADGSRGEGAEPISVEPIVESSARGGGSALAPSGGEVVPSQALNDLARAFQANADALRGIHELQGELAHALRRSDRAELMLQSTNALNETFRGLASIQRELLNRLEKPAERSSRLVPMMLIGLLIVFVGGIVAVVHVVDRLRAEQADPLSLAQEIDASRRRGRDEAAQEGEKELARSAKAVQEAEARLATLQEKSEEREKEYEQTLSEKRQLESEQSSLADEAVRLRGEAAARRAVEDEMRDTSAKLAVLEPKVQSLEADLAKERAEKERLQQKIAEHRMGLDTQTPTSAADAEQVPSPTSRPSPISHDARQLEAVRSAMNRMLEAGGQGKEEYWQLGRAQGVSADRLHDVVALRYDAHGKLLDSVEAKELVVWVDKTKRTVEFEFRQGSMVFDKEKTPFRGATLTRIVAEGQDAIRLWLASGLLLLRTR